MKVVSLFSGCGGLDLGLMKSGHEIIWANDIYKDAAETYRNNIGDHIDERDIREIPSSEIPDCEVVVGGFPCQGFSMANMKRNVEDIRNQLYKEMVRVVKDKQPKFFIGENVKGITSLGKGDVLKQVLSDFEKAGYDIHWKVVCAADYGVPQMRMRLIILGIRKDLLINNVAFPPLETHASKDKESNLKPWLSIGKALSHLPEPTENDQIPNHEYSKYKLRFNGHIGHRRIDPNKPAPTVTGRGDEKGGVVVLHHPNNHRRMSARELAATQSFPDDFIFSGTKTSAYRQVANAVPPLLGKAIGEMLSQNKIEIIEQENIRVTG